MEVEQTLGAAVVPTPKLPVRRIQADQGLFHINLKEVWRFRELLVFLCWRDIKARYRQTLLGGFWAIFRPFSQMVVFTFLFGGGVSHIKTGSAAPYALFIFPGIVMWTYFSSAAMGGATAIIGNAPLVTKAYFPRVNLVFAAILAPVIDFLLSVLVILGLFAFYVRWPSWHIVLVPLLVLLTFALALGMSLWLAPITVKYRDVNFAMPFILQMWMFLTPVIYPPTFLSGRLHWVLAVNPMTGVALAIRWAFIGGEAPRLLYLLTSLGTAVVLISTGIVYFRRNEPAFPDHI
jgi:lipopolysaccharide transport system permease protein